MPHTFPAPIAVVAARIPRFDALAPADRLRAAALALKRDFNVDDSNLKLAARSVGHGADENVLIAYTTQSRRADDSIDARWFDAAKTDSIYWLGVPEGIALSGAGAAAIEHWTLADGVPTPIMALVAQHAGKNSFVRRRLLIEDLANHIDEPTLDLWRASLGIEIERAGLPGVAQPIALKPPPYAVVRSEKSALDRALFACACVAALAALLSIMRYAALPSVATASNANRASASGVAASAASASTASGELWSSATLAAPALTDAMKSASFGGGAWVIAAPTLPRAALPAIASAVSANGLAVQTIVDPEPRVRVQKP